ncbi:hypothetical protein VTI28DRAFT_10517 [Corynascus sepedonium]
MPFRLGFPPGLGRDLAAPRYGSFTRSGCRKALLFNGRDDATTIFLNPPPPKKTPRQILLSPFPFSPVDSLPHSILLVRQRSVGYANYHADAAEWLGSNHRADLRAQQYPGARHQNCILIGVSAPDNPRQPSYRTRSIVHVYSPLLILTHLHAVRFHFKHSPLFSSTNGLSQHPHTNRIDSLPGLQPFRHLGRRLTTHCEPRGQGRRYHHLRRVPPPAT